MKITSHIIFEEECYFKLKIYIAVRDSLASYSHIDFTEENIEINLIKKQHGRYLVKFNLQFDEILSEEDNSIVENIFSTLSTLVAPKSTSAGIFKFHDDNQLALNKSFYEKVYAIEMQIREMFFYIFWFKYGKDKIYDFLSRFGNKYNHEEGKDYTKTFDHKLFYIMFSRYKELTKFKNLNTFKIPKKIKPGEDAQYLYNTIKNFNSIEDLISSLRTIWIDNEQHINLLAGISDYLDCIDKFRNAIAHNRHVEQNIVDSALPAIEKVRSLIDKFWEKEIDSDTLVDWFFSNYEDPANRVPYDSSEGGYQYWNGGPYEASEVLSENFPDIDEDILNDAVNTIKNDGYEWVRIGDY